MSTSSCALSVSRVACIDDVCPPASDFAAAIRDDVLHLEHAMPLHFGGKLEGAQIAWRLSGPANAPVVVALGGISAGRIVVDREAEKGWWSEIVGPGKALDATRFRILGIDFLGGSGKSTGPRAGQTNFPSISAYDQADAVRRVLDHLAIDSVAAVIGASYGGMVALAFGERWPSRVRRVISISAADCSHPMSTAWRSVQRAMVRYAIRKGDGPEGLRLARALAMATYRSPEEFVTRFDAPAVRVDGRFQFPVESYLLARGDAYAATHIPEAFVCLSESIDLHRVDPLKIRVPVSLVAVHEDQLVPLSDMRALASRLRSAEIIELSSIYGHDAFLKEASALKLVFTRALGELQ